MNVSNPTFSLRLVCFHSLRNKNNYILIHNDLLIKIRLYSYAFCNNYHNLFFLQATKVSIILYFSVLTDKDI